MNLSFKTKDQRNELSLAPISPQATTTTKYSWKYILHKVCNQRAQPVCTLILKHFIPPTRAFSLVSMKYISHLPSNTYECFHRLTKIG